MSGAAVCGTPSAACAGLAGGDTDFVWLIVPGERLGKVRLGMTHQIVHQTLGAPRSREQLSDGTLL